MKTVGKTHHAHPPADLPVPGAPRRVRVPARLAKLADEALNQFNPATTSLDDMVESIMNNIMGVDAIATETELEGLVSYVELQCLRASSESEASQP